jgi:hypothetical protein
MSVKVGIFGNETEDGTSVVDYAIYNEFGTRSIPARPFMATTVERYKAQTDKFIDKLAVDIEDNKIKPNMALKRLGLYFQAMIRKTIKDGPWTPNAPATIAIKGSSKPLVDTGRMIGAVNYEVTR